MGGLFKITIVQYWVYDCWVDKKGSPCREDTPGSRYVNSRRVRPGTPGAQKVKKKSAKWYARVPGGPRTFPLAANKVGAGQILRQMLAQIRAEKIRQSELTQAGLGDPLEGHRHRPLLEHLAEFETSLKAKGNTAKQVQLKIGRIRRLLLGCRFQVMGDLSASRVQNYLTELRQERRSMPSLPPHQEWFRRNEVANALGIQPATVSTLVQRHELEATGKGKARRFPRSTVLHLQERLGQGIGMETSNFYLREIKSFCRWLVQDRRTSDNPLVHLQGGNAKHDRRHQRRALSLEEIRQAIEAARQSTRKFRGLNGEDRSMLYTVASVTGFRASELASVCSDAFALEEDVPTVTLASRNAKNGKKAVQPLPADLVDVLRRYLAKRPRNRPVWPGNWPEAAADMFRIDLTAAGIPYVIDGLEGALHADFHALRHSYIALLDRSGATPKQAMQLARHSDPNKLTMAVYGRAQLRDLGEAVNRLPRLLGPAGGETWGEAGCVTQNPVTQRSFRKFISKLGACNSNSVTGSRSSRTYLGRPASFGKVIDASMPSAS